MLKRGTPYMMDRKGRLFELPYAHPYLLNLKSPTPVEEQMERVIKFWLGDLLWYYDNTKNIETKELIVTILNSLLEDDKYTDNNGNNYIEEILTTYSIPKVKVRNNFDVIEAWKSLNSDVNDEFIRVRTGHATMPDNSNQDIYFRIGSKQINWFPTIWEVIYENRYWVESVTVITDLKSRGKEEYYILGNQKSDHMSVEDFINLKGNPIVESIQDMPHIY